MKILGNIDVDLDVVNKEYVDKLKNNLNNYVPLATYEDFAKTNDLKYNDLLEQIDQIKAKDIDLSNYATKDDLASVDVSGQLKDYAKMSWVEASLSLAMNTSNELFNNVNGKLNDMVTNVGVDSDGIVKFLKDGKWYNYNSSSPLGNPVALKKHTHDEYLKKGDPIELTSQQKAELKGADGAKGDKGNPGPAGPTGPRGATGPKGADGTSVTVQVVNSVPSNQAPNVIYLVKA